LEAITARIAKDNPSAAKAFGLKLADEALTLSKFPEMGRVVPEFRDPTLREIIRAQYRIIYRLRNEPKRVHILRFWHAARSTPEI
jgi:plasmid stabilization system protein ParE